MQTSPELIEKYRLYMRAYGIMIAELSDNEDEEIKFIYATDQDLGALIHSLGNMISID